MEIYKITFWKEPYNPDNSFVDDKEAYLTTAIVTQNEYKLETVYHIKLNDIGLFSMYGEFNIVNKNGFWLSKDFDSPEFNFLKSNIICTLDYLNK